MDSETPTLVQPELTELAWAAGFFEGEGNIYRTPDKRATYRISVAQSGEEQVELKRFLAIVGCGNITKHAQSKYPNAKPFFNWRCSKRADIIKVAKLLTPYMCGPKLKQFHAFLSDVDGLCHWDRCYKYKRGLVIGKMYPYHIGHKALIDYASAHSEELDVIIVDRDKIGEYEGIPIKVRVNWLKQGHAQTNIRYTILKPPVGFPDVDDAQWAKLTKDTLGHFPTALFSHEHARDQGYAKRMDDCKFIAPPGTPPIRATLIRANPEQYSEYLDPEVQKWYQSQTNKKKVKALDDRGTYGLNQ